MKEISRKKDIAIVGLSGRFPKSENIEAFWKNLVEGNELVHNYTEEELKESGVEQEVLRAPNFIKSNSFIDNPESFDYSFFGYTKEEASLMDPQIRIMHEQVWLAIEDSACDISKYKGKIGLYLSASDNFNWKAYEMINRNEKISPFLSARLSDKNFISTLISYRLNLKGPSYYIDTACSSSLVSVHVACRNLLMKECSLAIAGGVSIDSTVHKGYFFEEGMISSKDGHCRAFDEESSGTIWGEGAGVVVLKRLEDALNDRDNIYAVIRSSAVNNDGKRKVGFTAPSVDGQADCIKLAHRIGDISADSISYIEAHGTGTRLGDPIEIEALNKAFDNNTNQRCAIGSVKTNMGHLDAAAGIAGLIKTSLAIQNRILPASLHFKKPNSEINFDSGPFYVNRELKKWEDRRGNILRAGVSSFGIGGTNSHIVLEEAPEIGSTTSSRPYQLLTYSGKTNSSINNYKGRLEDFIKRKKTSDLSDLAYSLKVGRQSFKHREFIVCKDKEDALINLQRMDKDGSNPIIVNKKRNVVFMYTGQGSQYFSMAKGIYFQEEYFRSIMDQGFQILKNKTGEDYAEIIGYTDNVSGDKQRINNTRYTQPLLFLIEYAFTQFLMKHGIVPDYMIGHSLGEYVAACISEVFSFDGALDIIVKRANLMSELESGEMLGVGTSKNNIQSLIGEKVSIASINTEDSCVVSGKMENVSELINILIQKEIPYTKLKTSHAFHSEMMDAILSDYEIELTKVNLSPPKYPFVSNLTAKEILPEEATSPKYWVRQLRETVNFSEGLSYLLKKQDSIFIEIGPGNTLSNFLKQNKRYNGNSSIANVIRHPKDNMDDNQYLTNSFGVLWSNGIDIDWKFYYESEIRNKISAPSYSFDKTILPAKINPFERLKNEDFSFEGSKGKASESLYRSNWKKAPIVIKNEDVTDNYDYLIFTEKTLLINALKSRLIEHENRVIEVVKGEKYEQINEFLYSINSNNEVDFIKLFNTLESKNYRFTRIIFNWNFKGKNQEAILSGCSVMLYLGMRLVRHNPFSDKKLVFLSKLNQRVLGNEKINTIMAAVKTIANSFLPVSSTIFNCCIDIHQNLINPRIISKIIDELNYNSTISNVAYRHNNRWIQFFEPVSLNQSNQNSYIKKNQTYLITGELGYIEKILSRYLCDKYNAKVILIGREIPNQNLWKGYLNAKDTDEDIVSKINEIQSLKQEGKAVYYYQGDVSDYTKFLNVVETIKKEHGKISGIIHRANANDSKLLKSEKDFDIDITRKLFNPRIQGTLNLYKLFKDSALDFVWIPSSLSSSLDRKVNGLNAVSDTFISAFIDSDRGKLDNWFCVHFDDLSDFTMQENELIEIFEKSFAAEPISSLIVALRDLNSITKGKKPNIINDKGDNTHGMIIERSLLNTAYIPPENEMEEKLCDLWQSFLGYEKIGIEDDFFELGGDSLKAMSLLKRILKTFNVEIGIQDFYLKANIKAISEEIDTAQKLISIQKPGSKKKTIKI